jgi:hypothetical protein
MLDCWTLHNIPIVVLVDIGSVAHESRTLNEKLDGFEVFTPEFNDSFPS